jgi:hypothetical protein
MRKFLDGIKFKGLNFSASAPAMSSLQSTLEDFLGGGLSVQENNGTGFSTVLDPTTGTYKTTIKTANTTVTTAGVGQSPVSLWQQLTSTSSGNWILIGLVLIVAIFAVTRIRR